MVKKILLTFANKIKLTFATRIMLTFANKIMLTWAKKIMLTEIDYKHSGTESVATIMMITPTTLTQAPASLMMT